MGDYQKCSLLLRTGKNRWRTQNENLPLGNVFKMSNIEHFPAVERCIMSR